MKIVPLIGTRLLTLRDYNNTITGMTYNSNMVYKGGVISQTWKRMMNSSYITFRYIIYLI